MYCMKTMLRFLVYVWLLYIRNEFDYLCYYSNMYINMSIYI